MGGRWWGLDFYKILLAGPHELRFGKGLFRSISKSDNGANASGIVLFYYPLSNILFF